MSARAQVPGCRVRAGGEEHPAEVAGQRQRGELRADAPPAMLATGLLASIEGGMVLSQTRKDAASLRIAVNAGLAQVRTYLS